MFAVSSDGAHLVVQDGFGLSRFTFGKGVKTDPSLAGHELSLAGNRALVLSDRSYKRALRTVDAMLNERFAPSDYGSYAIHPDGVHVIEWSHDVVFQRTEETKSKPHKWPRDLRTFGPIDLGRSRPSSAHDAGYGVISADATLGVYRPHARSLAVARVATEKTFEALYRVETNHPVGEIILYPSAEQTYFGAHDRAQRQAVLHSITPEGLEHRWALEARSAPVFGGGYWFWQRDEKTVCRADWRELDRPERFEIPSEFRGEGRAIGHGDRVLFLPFDGEKLIDLRTHKIIDRKLGAKDAPLRALATDIARVFDQWLAEEGGSITFGHIDKGKSSAPAVWSLRPDFGASTLSAVLAFGELLGRCSHDDRRNKLIVTSHTNPVSLAHVTLADVRRAFDAADRYGALLLRSLCAAMHALGDAFRMSPHEDDRKPLARHALLDEDAATVLLRAIDETVRAGAALPLASNIDAWAAKRWTPKTLAALRFPADAWSGPAALLGAFEIPMVAGYIALDLFGAEALDVIVRWFVERPAPHTEANPHIAADVCARMAQHHPETEQPFRAACAKAGSHGKELLRGFEFAMSRPG